MKLRACWRTAIGVAAGSCLVLVVVVVQGNLAWFWPMRGIVVTTQASEVKPRPRTEARGRAEELECA